MGKTNLGFFGAAAAGLIYAIVKTWTISSQVTGILLGVLILLIIGIVLVAKENKTTEIK